MGRKFRLRLAASLGMAITLIAASCDEPEEIGTEPYKGPWKVYTISELEDNTTINGLFMFSPSYGWACSDDAILKFEHGAWKVAFNLHGKYARGCVLKRIRFSSPTDGWAAGWEWQTGGGIRR